MKTNIFPWVSGIAVASMCAAALSHWWSVRQFVVALDAKGMKPASGSVLSPTDSGAVVENQAPAPSVVHGKATTSIPSSEEQKFYDTLISRMESLHTQNRDLLDQLAETNRDLMKLEFRVDSHSASFRPLPVNEEQPFTSLDADIGVLPPRAEPVFTPNP